MTESSRVEDETGGAASPGSWRARITGMDCGSCALTIADGLRKIAGVRAVAVDFTTETLEISGEITREQVEQRLKLLGYGLAPQLTPEAAMARAAVARSAERFFAFLLADTQQRLALAAAVAILARHLGVRVFTPRRGVSLRHRYRSFRRRCVVPWGRFARWLPACRSRQRGGGIERRIEGARSCRYL